MAITKILYRNGGLRQAIDYITNPVKTDENLLTDYIRCDPDYAAQQMMDTKRALGKTAGRQCYHIIQAFKPDEITPELAHEIARQFAAEHLPGYEAVIATHVDKTHIHSHIVFNSVNAVTGKMYHSTRENYYKQIRGISDQLCKAHGLSIVLENDEKNVIYQPDKNSYIKLLGVIEDNMVYGYMHKSDVGTMADGTKVTPCYELYIANTKGEVRRKYSVKNQYIQKINCNGNVINMTLCKRQGSHYVMSGEDTILNNCGKDEPKFSYVSRVTTKSLTEWYIQFPISFEMKAKPTWDEPLSTLTTSERYVRLEQPKLTKYYVFAGGQIVSSYESAAKAIREADAKMGVVVSSNHQVVWERSGAFIQNTIGGLEMTKQGNGVSNLDACVHMLLKANHYDVAAKGLVKKGENAYNTLSHYLQRPMSLKGCTLEEVLYFVSGSKPVIAMTSNKTGVVIGGYTASKLILYNPQSGKTQTVSRSSYEKIFKDAGNYFISYMSES